MIVHSTRYTLLAATALAAFGAASPAVAGTAAPAPAPTAAEAPAPQTDESKPIEGEDVIVTARAGNTTQRKVDASYAISTISAEELKMKAPTGVGEALKNVPGFWVESSSGETSGNIRVRGIPTDGYSQIALLEDGITIQHDPGLGWLNGDQSFRIDQTLDHIEVVRGGPSSIFYSNAPGAVVNFIERKGGDTLEGLVRYEGADYNSHRIDAWVGGPIGASGWHFFLGGYYRISDGQRHTGYQLGNGGQIRGTLSKTWDNASLEFSVKHMDEKVENAMVTPFVNGANGNPTGVAGFDALNGTVAGKETKNFTFLTPTGTYDFDAGVANTARLTQYSVKGQVDLGDGFTVIEGFRYRDSYQKRNSITPRSIYTYSDLLTALGSTYKSVLPAGGKLGLFYTNGGGAYSNSANGNGLVLLDLARSFTVPEKEIISDTRVQKSADFLGHHDLAFGFYYANVNEDYRATSASILTDVKNNASLLDAYALNAAGGAGTMLTDKGVLSYGTEYGNSHGTSDTIAFYGSDEWKITDKLRLDGGVRWEKIDVRGVSEGTKTVNLGQSATAADDAVLVGSGVYTPFKASYDHAAWTVGVNYQFQRSLGMFARYTSTYRLPGVSSFFGNPTLPPITQTMKFQEVGLKFARPKFNLFVTGFRTLYESYQISDYKQDSAGKYVLNTVYGNTKTLGAEVEGTWRPFKWFDVHANYTYQDARFSKFAYTTSAGVPVDYSDKRLIRVPENQFRITPGLNLLDNRIRIESDISFYGQRWADVANQINLPSYKTVDLNARFDATDKLSFNMYVNNLFNEVGLTEGNPRAGTIENEEVGKAVYIARSIFGRSIRGAVTYRF